MLAVMGNPLPVSFGWPVLYLFAVIFVFALLRLYRVGFGKGTGLGTQPEKIGEEDVRRSVRWVFVFLYLVVSIVFVVKTFGIFIPDPGLRLRLTSPFTTYIDLQQSFLEDLREMGALREGEIYQHPGNGVVPWAVLCLFGLYAYLVFLPPLALLKRIVVALWNLKDRGLGRRGARVKNPDIDQNPEK